MTFSFRASFTPASIDEDARTVELIASTGAGVSRYDIEGPFREDLAVSTAAIDLGRLEGMPLLDSHRQDSLDRVLGTVRAARVEAGQLIVKVEVSARAEAYWRDIKAGIIRNVSIGYLPISWKDGLDAKGARVRTITRWELREVSLVPVGADPTAHVRTASMDELTAPAPEIISPPLETRAAVNGEIRALATTFDLGPDWANGLIDRGATEGEARAAALEALRVRTPRTPILATSVGAVGLHDDPTQFRSLVGEAVYATRANPSHQLSEPARRFASMTTLDIARECCRRSGIATTGLSAPDTFTRALTTSDFPVIFADTANRSLRARYASAPSVLKRLARQSTARDFRAKTKVSAADLAKLEKISERGEYRHSGFIEGKESYRIDTFGTIISLSRKMIINDDIGAFADQAARLGEAAAEFENEFLVNLLTVNAGLGPTMDDGKTVFHANHGNLAATGAALTTAALSAARLAMRRQTGLNGRPIAVTPRYLMVPPELETTAELVLASVQAAKTEDVNPFGGKLELLVEARLTDTGRWYVAADPTTAEGLEYSYLQGEEGPQTETRNGFDTDGVDVKIRLDFGAAFLDWRGWYTNGGA